MHPEEIMKPDLLSGIVPTTLRHAHAFIPGIVRDGCLCSTLTA